MTDPSTDPEVQLIEDRIKSLESNVKLLQTTQALLFEALAAALGGRKETALQLFKDVQQLLAEADNTSGGDHVQGEELRGPQS